MELYCANSYSDVQALTKVFELSLMFYNRLAERIRLWGNVGKRDVLSVKYQGSL